ncbi:MGDG synthase family glycosyltransferase [Fusibacter sp. JL216-2]|uniref:MGDG synthase family glycosyltransferase n=1 Tax=Fusibacter sp. JL216-2 TaxID=3071453 RepID=UPI003D324A86
MKCDVLILTSAFGNGHNSVASAIREQLLDKQPGLKITTEDIMDISTPKAKNVFFNIYTLLTRSHPSVYNFFYKIKKDIPNNAMDEVLYNIYLKRVGDYIEESSPKLIISTFPLCSGFVSKVKERYGIDVPLITAITDVVDSWEWIHNKTDMYFVPCKRVGEKLVLKGIDEDKIRITGIPVKKEFLSSQRNEKNFRQVLIMGGAMDKLGLNPSLLEKLNKIPNTRTIVVTGKNEDLYARLTEGVSFDNVEVLGYTKDVAKLMDASDLVVTKPGGVTLFEAINKEIPVILKSSMVGQEEENVNFIKTAGIGILIEGEGSLYNQVEHALNDPDSLMSLRKNIEEIKTEMEPQKLGAYALELM